MPLDQFGKLVRSKDGLTHKCRDCTTAYQRAYYAANRERITRQHAEYYQANRKASDERAQRWREHNRERARVHTARYRAKPGAAERRRAAWLRDKYGIESEEQYVLLLERQDHRCAICRRPPRKNERLHVDHCHDTGMVRGLLCKSCNLALGMLRDSPALVEAALNYLNNPPARA